MKYNRALDLLCAAVVYQQQGKPLAAAKCFAAATKCESIEAALKVVEASNGRAHQQLVQASRRVRSGTDSVGILDESPGAELKVEPDENGDRVVQEADFDDLSDLDSLDEPMEAELDDLDSLDDPDSVFEAATLPMRARREATATAAAPARPTARPTIKSTANADFARALKNIHVLSSKRR